MSLSIRPARSSDYEALCALWEQVDALHATLLPDLFRAHPGKPRPQHHLERALQAKDEVILVAEVTGEKVVGVVHLKIHRPSLEAFQVPRIRGFMEDIVVDRGHSRQGIGRMLMDHAVRWCREQGASQLVLTVWAGNHVAEAFYRRLGYVRISQVLGIDL